MHKLSFSEIVDIINRLRAAAGLAPKKYPGTSKQAVIIIAMKAQRGEFC